ncbi:dihydrodipicolinate reductase [Nocardia nova SH22a]|uniref:Dihydrodipicolinate reductase n=1 Tax=Nocardia nova SH22a TaxID=1415166 RepID=W5TJG2_9NOCA|nr:dihydrodipicolinate reductase [Nocardia nova]AHH19118.1 dihydrodipicolinate reductase [Nocardia nova SH22a]
MSPDTAPSDPVLRVAQWATGNIGSRALRAVIAHPGMELAGLYVHGPGKAGTDAGALCGVADTGVAATNSIDDILAARPDCVLYMPQVFDAGEICRLLESGVNIVTTCGRVHHPASMDAALRDRIESACRAGGTSIHATGSSPGFITEAIPLALASIQRRLDGLLIEEFADLSQRDSPAMLFEVMGFGQPATAFDQGRADYVGGSFAPSLLLLADTLGLEAGEVRTHGEYATTPADVGIAAGTLSAGTVAAQRITVSVGPILTFRATWYCAKVLDADWDLRDTGWHIDIAGDAPLDVDLRFPFALDRMSEMSPGYTANRAVNAVPAVCRAEPGIRTTLDLPHLISALV